jgi:opacity protein-like surface antigen
MRTRHLMFGVGALVAALGWYSVGPAQADWVHEGQANEGKWTLGARTGFNIPTQSWADDTKTSIGPTPINLQAMYGISKWIRLGFMMEWERRSIDSRNPSFDLGTLNTVSLLPTVEFRPGHFSGVTPYLSTSIGVNVNSFSEDDDAVKISQANTFAYRLAGGLDFPLTHNLMLNTEAAWKRNRGGLEINNRDAGSVDASTISLLVGVRYTF